MRALVFWFLASDCSESWLRVTVFGVHLKRLQRPPVSQSLGTCFTTPLAANHGTHACGTP